MKYLIATGLLATASAFAQAPIKIGEINSYSAIPQFTQPYKQGWQLAVEQINAQGGLLGRKVEVMVLDNKCNPSEGVNVANKLVEAKVVAIEGAHCSSPHLATMKIVEAAKIPMITGIASNAQITDLAGPGRLEYSFRISPGDQAMMDALGSYLSAKKIFKTVAIVSEDTDFGRGGADVFKKVVEKVGIEVVSSDFHAQGAPDFTSILTRLQQRKPDGIATFQTNTDALNFLRQAMQIFPAGFQQVYGLTETTGAITLLPPEDHDPAGNKRMRSAGLPMPGIELRILDGAGGVLPANTVGEIAVRSSSNMAGYWKLDEATAKTIDADGWLRTGDAGYLDEDGYLFIHDRVKDMIISGGENIYPAEVESAICDHPDVAEVAVVGVPDEQWGEAVKAVVVMKPGKEATLPRAAPDHEWAQGHDTHCQQAHRHTERALTPRKPGSDLGPAGPHHGVGVLPRAYVFGSHGPRRGMGVKRVQPQ